MLPLHLAELRPYAVCIALFIVSMYCLIQSAKTAGYRPRRYHRQYLQRFKENKHEDF